MDERALRSILDRLDAIERRLDQQRPETTGPTLLATVGGLNVNKSGATTGQVVTSGRMDSDVGFGRRHLAGVLVGNGLTTTFTSILTAFQSVSLLVVKAMFGDTSTTRLYLVSRNTSSGTYCRGTLVATTEAVAVVAFTVAFADATGVVTLTNNNGANVLFYATELALTTSGTQ